MASFRPSHELSAEQPKPDLVDMFLAEENMSAAERQKRALQRVGAEFQRAEGDTGSTEVQVARMTQRVTWLAEHMRRHPKDYHSRRGLEMVLARRRKLLTYLRGNNFDAYAQLLTRLGLKDNYAKEDRLTLRMKLKSKK